ncbi:Mannan-binding lectin serine protease [Dirofilaria immitis]
MIASGLACYINDSEEDKARSTDFRRRGGSKRRAKCPKDGKRVERDGRANGERAGISGEPEIDERKAEEVSPSETSDEAGDGAVEDDILVPAAEAVVVIVIPQFFCTYGSLLEKLQKG